MRWQDPDSVENDIINNNNNHKIIASGSRSVSHEMTAKRVITTNHHRR